MNNNTFLRYLSKKEIKHRNKNDTTTHRQLIVNFQNLDKKVIVEYKKKDEKTTKLEIDHIM